MANINYKIDYKNFDWISAQVKGFYGKELIHCLNGGVKMIKIESKTSYPEHIHPDKTEYAFVIEGCPEFLINGLFFKAEAGDFFIFSPHVKHAIKNNSNRECRILIGSINN